jgi:peptide chain release factor subunit 1
LKLYNKARVARARRASRWLSRVTSLTSRCVSRAQVPPNGLVLYTGTILTDEGKEKKVNIDFEPFKTINTSLYLCDNKFHTEALSELLESENKYGFIVMDGNGSLFGTLSGNTREILHKFSVDLPKKHGRGGQSALRFARLRMEKRHNYVRKVRPAHRIAAAPHACSQLRGTVV